MYKKLKTEKYMIVYLENIKNIHKKQIIIILN